MLSLSRIVIPAARVLGSLQPCLVPRLGVDVPTQQLSVCPVLLSDSKMVGRSAMKMKTMLAHLDFDSSVNEVVNLDALAQAEDKMEKKEEDEYVMYPDENTNNALFNGIRFTDLPIVHLTLHRNNTKLHARHADNRPIYQTTPSRHGFINAKKRTNVAGQVAGLNMGQKLRGIGIKVIRLRISGFNAARISTVQGITQAGIQIVAIQDVTQIDWHWLRRAKGRPSKN